MRIPVLGTMLITLLATVFGFDAICRGQPSSRSVNAKLLSEAQVSWKNYEKMAKLVSLRVVEQWTSTDRKGTVNAVGNLSIKSNARCISIEETDPFDSGNSPESKTRIAKVFGPQYEFKAQQSVGNSDWALTSLLDHHLHQAAIQRKEIPSDKLTLRAEIEARHLLIAVAIENYLIRSVQEHECCRTERFEALSAEPGALVEWRFAITAEKRPKYMIQVEYGRILFDPANMWTIRESSVGCRNGVGGITTIKKSFSYQKIPNGTPIPLEMKFESGSDDKSFRASGVSRYEVTSPAPSLPDSSFTLSAYGIPEVAHAQGSIGDGISANAGTQTPQTPQNTEPFGWYIPMAIAGGVLIAVALAIRFIVSRRGRTASQK